VTHILAVVSIHFQPLIDETIKLRGFGPLANYADSSFLILFQKYFVLHSHQTSKSHSSTLKITWQVPLKHGNYIYHTTWCHNPKVIILILTAQRTSYLIQFVCSFYLWNSWENILWRKKNHLQSHFIRFNQCFNMSSIHLARIFCHGCTVHVHVYLHNCESLIAHFKQFKRTVVTGSQFKGQRNIVSRRTRNETSRHSALYDINYSILDDQSEGRQICKIKMYKN
jgi:hypothetical protein